MFTHGRFSYLVSDITLCIGYFKRHLDLGVKLLKYYWLEICNSNYTTSLTLHISKI